MSHSHLAVKTPWQQVFDITLFVAVDDGGKNAGDVGIRLNSVQFASFYQGGEHGPVLCP